MLLSGTIALNTLKLEQITPPNLDSLTEMIGEWELQPYTSIRLQDRDCTHLEDGYSGGEAIWWREWAGTEQGCYIPEVDPDLGITIPAQVKTYKSMLDSKSEMQCEEIVPAHNPVIQSQFKNKYFCAIRGGDPFISVQRPLLETGLCPQGTEACSRSTSAENTVCYPPADHASKCPILKVKFMKLEKVGQYKF